MDDSRTIDIRNLTFEDWDQEVGRMIQGLQAGESFYILSGYDISHLLPHFEIPEAKIRLDFLERGARGWLYRFSRLRERRDSPVPVLKAGSY